MSDTLTAADVAAAISELADRSNLVMGAVAELAAKTGHVSARAELSDVQALEVERLCLSHPKMLRSPGSSFPDLGDGSYEEEVVRLTAMSRQQRPHSARAARQAESQTLALTAGGAVSQYGLPVTYAGRQISADEARRLGLGRTLPVAVADVTDEPAEDISSWVGRSTGGLGDGPDVDPDLGPDVSDFGQQTDEYSNPGVVADPAAEVNRLVQQHGSAVAGLRSGATKNRHPATGRYTKTRLTGVLSGV